jgi:hypothetical protein
MVAPLCAFFVNLRTRCIPLFLIFMFVSHAQYCYSQEAYILGWKRFVSVIFNIKAAEHLKNHETQLQNAMI